MNMILFRILDFYLPMFVLSGVIQTLLMAAWLFEFRKKTVNLSYIEKTKKIRLAPDLLIMFFGPIGFIMRKEWKRLVKYLTVLAIYSILIFLIGNTDLYYLNYLFTTTFFSKFNNQIRIYRYIEKGYLPASKEDELLLMEYGLLDEYKNPIKPYVYLRLTDERVKKMFKIDTLENEIILLGREDNQDDGGCYIRKVGNGFNIYQFNREFMRRNTHLDRIDYQNLQHIRISKALGHFNLQFLFKDNTERNFKLNNGKLYYKRTNEMNKKMFNYLRNKISLS